MFINGQKLINCEDIYSGDDIYYIGTEFTFEKSVVVDGEPMFMFQEYPNKCFSVDLNFKPVTEATEQEIRGTYDKS